MKTMDIFAFTQPAMCILPSVSKISLQDVNKLGLMSCCLGDVGLMDGNLCNYLGMENWNVFHTSFKNHKQFVTG